MSQPGFNGLRIVAFESRLADVMETSLRKYGGDPLVAPSMQEIPLTKNPEAFAFAEKLFDNKIDLIIFMTGVGTQFLMKVLSEKYSVEEIVKKFSQLTVIARGPKPVKALKEYNIPITVIVPEPNTWLEIIQTLESNEKSLLLKGKTVAIQEYGIETPELIKWLKKKEVHIIQVPVYKWGLPDDTGPLKKAIDEVIKGKIRMAFFTSATQIRHVLKVAQEEGTENDFRRAFQKVSVCSVGPVASAEIQKQGFQVDFEPSRPKLGILVSEAAQNAHEILKEKERYPDIQSIGKTLEKKKQNKNLTHDSVFLKACRLEETPYTPVWLMRQAGRYMKDYERIRRQVSFLELCKTKELVTEVTVTAQEKLNADAAIIFSDILLILEPMGLGLEYEKGKGPVISGKLQDGKDVDVLKEVEPKETLNFVFDGIRLTRECLDPKIPLIGFSGAPFTLAAYMIEGGGSKNFLKAKKFMNNDPSAWHALLEKISRALVKYLNAQIEAGANALQIFDSWVGCLSPSDYREMVLPHTKSVIDNINGKVPIIHFGTGTAPFLREFREAGGDVIGVDYRIELDRAWQIIGHDVGIQGNIDPAILHGSQKFIQEHVKKILAQAGRRPGHIFNLGHGILPTTPEENAITLIKYVHELSQK